MNAHSREEVNQVAKFALGFIIVVLLTYAVLLGLTAFVGLLALAAVHLALVLRRAK